MRCTTDQFTYDPKTKTFSAEISDLGPATTFSRLFDDACDEGIFLLSSRTGDTVRFLVSSIRFVGGVNDRELGAWVLHPYIPDQKKFPGAAGCSIVLYND